MRPKPRTSPPPASIANRIRRVLGEESVDSIARSSGFLRRKREVTPLALAVACLSALAVGGTRWLADIHRTFNRFAGAAVQYKPFHNQLAKASFAEFFRQLLEQALGELTLPVLEAIPNDKLARFEDIIIHDGSSMALKDCLADAWPGRFTKVSPAAVEMHVTMSALQDRAVSVTLAPDKEAEGQFAPPPQELRKRLLLADRGYENQRMLREIQEQGGAYIIRGKKNIRPLIRRAWDSNGRALRRLQGKQLTWDVLPNCHVDLEVSWGPGASPCDERIVVFPVRDSRNRRSFTYLHTSLSRDEFTAWHVGQLYRLRWQIELLFKEWKSYGNLHRFDTSKAPIAEGLIWASLLGATLQRFIAHAAERTLGLDMSTMRVAASARHYLDRVLRALLGSGPSLARSLADAFGFMRDNTCRAHPNRDRKRGRLSSGLRLVAVS